MNSELHYLRVYLYMYYDAIFIFILEHIQSKKICRVVCRVKLPSQDFKYLSFKINKITNLYYKFFLQCNQIICNEMKALCN